MRNSKHGRRLERDGVSADHRGGIELMPECRCPHPTFAEPRKSDWISDVKSRKSRRRSAHAKNDRLRSVPLSPLVGYMRVSKADGSQVLDLQRDALVAVGIAERNIYSDTAS